MLVVSLKTSNLIGAIASPRPDQSCLLKENTPESGFPTILAIKTFN